MQPEESKNFSSVQSLPDLLPPSPRVVFIGTAASRISAAAGAYYANPSNKFWRTLHAIGLTPRLYAPHEFAELAPLSIGLTDLCKTQSGMDHEISAFDAAALRQRLAPVRPRALAFTSKKGASLYLDRPTHNLRYGAQAGHEAPALFVLPSPSGAANGSWSMAPWRELARWFNSTDDAAPPPASSRAKRSGDPGPRGS